MKTKMNSRFTWLILAALSLSSCSVVNHNNLSFRKAGDAKDQLEATVNKTSSRTEIDSFEDTTSLSTIEIESVNTRIPVNSHQENDTYNFREIDKIQDEIITRSNFGSTEITKIKITPDKRKKKKLPSKPLLILGLSGLVAGLILAISMNYQLMVLGFPPTAGYGYFGIGINWKVLGIKLLYILGIGLALMGLIYLFVYLIRWNKKKQKSKQLENNDISYAKGMD